MVQMFREERAYADNSPKANFVFMGYPFSPPLPKDDYAKVVADIQTSLPVRLWYFLDEVTTAEMMRKVWRAILRADICVFDVSGGNPNVAFELGLAVATDRRCITMLKSGESNPLGTADLGYAERMEYASAETLKERLMDFLKSQNSGLRRLHELSYDLVPPDDSLSRESVQGKLVKLVTKVFNARSVTMTGAKEIMGSPELASAVLQKLRADDIVEMVGERRGARYRFGSSWVYHDHEVAGEA